LGCRRPFAARSALIGSDRIGTVCSKMDPGVYLLAVVDFVELLIVYCDMR
jgi:hypothetical protein